MTDLKLRVAQESDLPFVRTLLESSGLPRDILEEQKGDLWVFEGSDGAVGCGAFEFYGEDALLRSVAIKADMRGGGNGSMMLAALESEARNRGVQTIWLLTETAEQFFSKHGYETAERNFIVNKGILDSTEFTHLCASSAVCMMKQLPHRNEREHRS